MVMEAPLSRRGSAKSRRVPLAASPEGAPTPAGPVRTATEIPWTRVDLDLYEVGRGGCVLGYVEVVGAVFVALGGPRYDRAVEVSQHVTFPAAVEALLRRAL